MIWPHKGSAPPVAAKQTPTLFTRIGADMRKAPSMKNGGMKSGTRERAQVGASDLQASPLAEGDRQLG